MSSIKTGRAIFAMGFGILVIMLLSCWNAHPAESTALANESIVQGFYDVKESTLSLADAKIPVLRILNVISTAEGALNSRDYSTLKEKTDEIALLNKLVRKIKKLIDDGDVKYSGLTPWKLNLTSDFHAINSAKIAFEANNYEEALALITWENNRLDGMIINISGTLEGSIKGINYTIHEEGIDSQLIAKISAETEKAYKSSDYASIIISYNSLPEINHSLRMIIEASNLIKGLEGHRRQTKRLEDIKVQAIDSLDNKDYESSILYSEEIIYLAQLIRSTESVIAETQSRISVAGSMKEARLANETLHRAINELELENYEDSQESAQEAYDIISGAESQSLLFGSLSNEKARFNIIKSAKENPWIVPAIIMVFLLIAILFIKASRIITIRFCGVRIKKLTAERGAIEGLIKRNQVEYFVKKSIDIDTYNNTAKKHQEMLLNIEKKIPLLKEKIEKNKGK